MQNIATRTALTVVVLRRLTKDSVLNIKSLTFIVVCTQTVSLISFVTVKPSEGSGSGMKRCVSFLLPSLLERLKGDKFES